jgi:hypothetical protein
MKAIEKAAAAILVIGALYVVSVIFLAFTYHTLKALGL